MAHVLIGKKAPSFTATAAKEQHILEQFSLENYRGSYTVLFFYPLNFTFVCPTELHAFEEAKEEFKLRNAEVVGCSVDSVYSHLAWLSMSKEKGGIQGVSYPLISDLNKEIATQFQVLSHEGIAYRGLFILDQEGIIRHQLINDLPIGRSVDEVIRVLDALIFTQKEGSVCPANWKKGHKMMVPSQEGVESYFKAD
ncbi:peroxiredoxin [Rhabdochlamydiaceae symbiont of Dictyostelium giganteum]|uniref:peroxiredoxin n=1 Tax=Rhabdochlamydiaceae symbiont of Dictyostelium giganteum TaxID=3342349 RepID=UPI00384BC135